MGASRAGGGPTTVDQLIELERRIENEAASTAGLAASQPALASAAARVRATAGDHRRKLEEARERVTKVPPRLADLRLLDALGSLYSSLNAAALAYTALHALAHRAYDSSGEGNTADLAESHLTEHAKAIQELGDLVSDVALLESSSRGVECHCKCPACGIGLCLCSPHGAMTLRQAWQETTASPAPGGVRLRPPRAESEMSRSDAAAGELIAAIEGKEIANDLELSAVQGAIRAHESGEEIRLTVRGRGAATREITIRRP